MTEGPMERSNRAGRFSWLWMLLAVLSVGGFLGWLGVNSQAISVAVVEEEVVDELDVDAAEVVELDDLMEGVEVYSGKMVRLVDIEVTSRLGEQAFWSINSKGQPFLVKLGRSLVEEGLSVTDGEVVTVVGQLREVSDFILDGWELDGVLQSEEDRMLAEFATEYLDVVELSGGSSLPADSAADTAD